MSYLTASGPSNRKLTALGVAVLVHIALIYALLTGLASDALHKIQKATEAVEIKVEKPKEEPPPPPPEKLDEIPVVTPPPDVVVQTQSAAPPPITTTTTVSVPTPQPTFTPAPEPRPAPPPPPPKPAAPAVAARIRGNPQSLITADDYPDSSLRAEEEGVTAISYDVSDKGRVENCTVTSSSGHPKLDEATCTIATRRFRLDPARAEGGAVMRGTGSFRFRWQIPKDR